MNRARLTSIGLFCASVALAGLSGCSSPGATVAAISGGTLAATAVGAFTPTHEIEQTYYLGVFDPQEQVPPAMYRVRVHGQASGISSMRFGSGWVPSSVVDSLNTSFEYDMESGDLSVKTGESKHEAKLQPGRRLVLFGPEGFREAPKDHRLVVVMGSSPEAWFNAVDEALGFFGQTLNSQRTEELERRLFRSLARVKGEQQRLADLESDRRVDAAGGER